MSVLSMVEAKLPPGFRFHPRDDELVCDYLAPKVGKKDVGRSLLLLPGLSEAMVDVDLNKCEPWDLPAEAACVGGKEWYFFSIKDRKYATGQRTNRATESGYWKATGKDRRISRKGKLEGMRKTLVFYRGRAPKGKKTEWVMHEYRIQSKDDSSQLTTKQEDWVLCRVFSKEKGGGGATPKPKALANYPSTRDTAYTMTYLPPLTDSHIASSGNQFVVPEASTMDNNLGNFGLIEQVPCFSSFNNNNSGSSSASTLSASNCTPATVMINNTMGQWLDHPAQYESSFLKVLDQLSKPNLSEGYENHINGWNPF